MSFLYKNPSLKENVFYKKGVCMLNNEGTILEVNDYLDLYLLAKSLGDQAWQEEIITNLQNYNQHQVEQNKSIHNLWSEFKRLNEKILELYQELRTDSTNNSYLEERIMDLKQKRVKITRQLRLKKDPSIESL